MKQSKVYVIIVTYNAMNWVNKCFSSLRESTIKVYPVVIDNGSKDETIVYIKEHYPEVHIIANSRNRGFGQANNQGIEYAYQQGASHFFLLNQDAWVHTDTIEKLVYIQNKYNISLISPIHLNGKGNKLDHNFYNAITSEEIGNTLTCNLMLGIHHPYYLIKQVNAAAWLLNRKTIEEIGGFDPLFFHYGEDINYLNRLHYHKKDIAIVPQALIHHDRKEFGNMKIYDKRATISALLTTYSNISEPFIHPNKKRLKLHAFYIYLIFKSTFTFRFTTLWYIIKGYFTFLLYFPKIMLSRKRNKSKFATWLNIK